MRRWNGVVTARDVAVLIPSYGRPAMTRDAVSSALATGAGEVIVSEDASGEDMSTVLGMSDPRLTVVSQAHNLGLWPNHLALLRMTDKPWIKFLQTDDALAPECLERMLAATGPETALVSALPVYRDLDTGEVEERYVLDEPLRWQNGTYVDRMARAGNEPGRPSYTLFRRDALLDTEEAWRNDMSCDLVANVVAASQGEVVLLPPGLVTCGIHRQRDGATQSFDLLAQRLTHSLEFLSQQADLRVRRFAAVYGAAEGLGLVRTWLGKRKKSGEGRPSYRDLAAALKALRRCIRFGTVARHGRWCREYVRWKYQSQRPIRIVREP